MLKSIPTLQNLGWLISLTYFSNSSAWYVYTRTTKMRLDKDDLSEVRGLDEETSTSLISAVDSGGAGGARAPPRFGGSGKGRSLISAYRSLAITTNTPDSKSYLRR